MREPPFNLSNPAIVACLHTNYGLMIDSLVFLPLGYDASAWVYRAQANNGTIYFVKVRLSITNYSSLLVPRYLHNHGVTQVIAPLPTQSQALSANIEAAGYVLILYPFVVGTSGMEQGLSDQQWIEYGAILRQIHTTAIAPELAQHMQQEQFSPTSIALINRLDAHIEAHTFTDPAEQELRLFWQSQREQIQILKGRLQYLAQQMRHVELPFVLCHADIHTNNVLLDETQQIWIVDWDEAILAPKERDLMFVSGGGISRRLVGPREEQLFFQGYGQVAIDQLALAYYRYAWAVSDLSEYAAQVYFRDDFSAKTKQAGVDGFTILFQAGEIVDLAFEALAESFTFAPTDPRPT